jgi:hypothetical protein
MGPQDDVAVEKPGGGKFSLGLAKAFIFNTNFSRTDSLIIGGQLMITKKILLVLIMAGITVILVTAMVTQSRLSSASSPGQQMEGSWLVAVAGEGLPRWYSALATFTRDGGVVQTVTDPLISTGHGEWVRTGDREFAVTTLLLRFDETGDFIGTIKGRAVFKLNETLDELTSDRYLWELFDRDGNPLSSGVGTAQGTRIRVEPLD